MAKTTQRKIKRTPVADSLQQKKPRCKTQNEQEGKLRPTKVELKHPAKQRIPEYCRLNSLFHDQKKMETKLKEMMLLCPDSQKDLFFEWLAQSPFDVDPNTWSREQVPSFLAVDNPLDDFTFRLNIILDTVVSDYNRSVVEHSRIPHAEHDFRGCALMTDQAESTRDAKNRSQQDVDATVGRMHKYLICSSVPFRAMMDTLIGDALSQVVMATGDNMSLCATEAARVLLTVNTLFAKHNELVDHELKTNGHAESLRIHIRASMAMGDIFINKNQIRPTVICDSMNRAARFNGVAQKDEIVVDGDAHKYLDPYFRLSPAQPAEEIQHNLDLVEKRLKKLAKESGDSPDNKEALMEKYELHARAAKLCGILFHVFERRNLQDDQLQDAKTHYLLERENHEMGMKTLLVDAIRKKLCKVEDLSAVENSVGREYYQEKFAKATGIKLKGLDKNEINVWNLHGYLTFKENLGVVPKECRFRNLFLDGDYQGENGQKSELEKFVEDISTHYGCPTKTNFNPLAEFYVMYLMQHTGSPSFAFSIACRAAGTTLHILDEMQVNWGSQPDRYLQNLQERMVGIGVFDPKGNVNEEKLKEYVAKRIVLPSLLAEVGLLKLADPPESDQGVDNAFSKAQRIGGIFAKSLATVQADHGPEVVETIKTLHKISKDLLVERNKAARKLGAKEDVFPQETIEVLEKLSFFGRNMAIVHGKGDEVDLATEVIRLSRAVQSMRTRKAYQAEKPAVDWVTIGSELSTTNIYPYMRRVYRELLLCK
jgi:class 3 adenylate cyclase